MLEWLLRWSIRHRGAVVSAWIAIAVSGLLAFRALPFDAFPDTTPVQAQVDARAGALGPLEVERLVTMPLEQALGGLPGLVELRSLSRPGFSQVTLTFDDDTELSRARQSITERLAGVELPEGVERPALGPVATGLGEVFHYLVRGEGLSPASARATQDQLVAPRLRAVPGVAEVNSWGGDERRIEVIVELEELQVRGLTLGDVVAAIEHAQGTVGGGIIESGGEATLIQARGLLADAASIESIPILHRESGEAPPEGAPVLIRDVARVAEGRELRHGAVTASGAGEAVLGLAFMLPGQNSHDVTTRLAARLDEISKALPPGTRADVVYQRSDLVDRVLATVRANLWKGALLVIAVLFVFLGNLRAGLLVALAIPFSLLVAFDLMLAAGVAGTLMSLGAIDFGLVVDSSVIMVENATRRLEESPEADPERVVTEAAVEVRRPTLFGELIIMAVYLPILTLEGLEGRLFRPMALTVIFALAGSMLLSLTLVPALASLVLRSRARRRGTGAASANARPGFAARLTASLVRLHGRVLAFALARRSLVLSAALALVAGAGLLATRLGAEFVPRLSEGTVVINTVRLASVSLEESVRMGSEMERLLLARFPDEIEDLWTRTGSAEIATDPMGVEVSDVFIQLTPRQQWTQARTHDELVERMRAVASAFPGMRSGFTQPIEMRVNEMVAGIRSDVGVKIFGDDLEALRASAAAAQRVLQSIPGAADVTIEQVTGSPVLIVDIDRTAAARHGVDAHDVLDAVAALGGLSAGEMQEGLRRVPIAVRLPDASRLDAARVGGILVTSSLGGRVPVSDVARLEIIDAPSAVQREWGRRRVVVQANVAGRDVRSFVDEARRRIEAEVTLPPGSFVRFGGQFEHLERAQARLAIVVPITLALILALLHVTYGSWIDSLRVFTGVPLAAVGGVFALWLRGMPFSVSAAVGFVALSGVAVLADMVLVSTIRQLTSQGRSLLDAVREAASLRLRPVLMTALVASLGFLPMALSEGPGAEVQRPLATVVIGGVLSSTLLTLVVLPVLYASLRSATAAAAARRTT